jgi:PIN domain nuclease of toxin-antitoxin system
MRPEKLSANVRHQLVSPSNEIFLSPVSIWEAQHLVRRNRLRIRETFQDWLNKVFAVVPLREAPFNFAVVAEASHIELSQSDLVDVFLAATALVFELTLVTGTRN